MPTTWYIGVYIIIIFACIFVQQMNTATTSQSSTTRLDRWQTNWNEGRYSIPGQGFHQATVHPYLEKFLPLLNLVSTEHIPNNDIFNQNRILLPLCGKTVDMIYLCGKKINVLGLEAVPRAIEEFGTIIDAVDTDPKGDLKQHILLHKEAQHRWIPNNNGVINIIQGDAMTFEIDDKGPLDGIWDRGSLVAIRPEDRVLYVTMCSNAIKTNGRLLLSVVEHDIMQVQEETIKDDDGEVVNIIPGIPYGPPYSFTATDVIDLYQGRFKLIKELIRENKLDDEPRWKSKGATKFEEVCYLLEKM